MVLVLGGVMSVEDVGMGVVLVGGWMVLRTALSVHILVSV